MGIFFFKMRTFARRRRRRGLSSANACTNKGGEDGSKKGILYAKVLTEWPPKHHKKYFKKKTFFMYHDSYLNSFRIFSIFFRQFFNVDLFHVLFFCIFAPLNDSLFFELFVFIFIMLFYFNILWMITISWIRNQPPEVFCKKRIS